MQTTNTLFPVISDESVEGIDLSPGETIFTGYNDIMETFISFKDSGGIELIGKQENIPLTFLGLQKDHILSYQFTAGGLPTVIVDDAVFNRLKKDIDPNVQNEFSHYIGIDINER